MRLTGSALKIVVDELFHVIKDRSTKTELVFVCPQPGCGDNTGNRSVNLQTGKTNCFRCNKGGDFVKWAKWLGYTIDETGVANAVPLEELNFEMPVAEKERLPVVADIRLPDGFTYCHDKPRDVYTELIAEMAERKNLTIEDLMEARVGFTKLNLKWEPYAIFPVIEYGHVVYYQGRTYVDEEGKPTKRFPDRQEAPYGAKYWIYGIDELRASKSQVVIVVESILNVLSLRKYMRENGLTGAVPVSVFKHYMSTPQKRKIMKMSHVKEVCLLYDHDATDSSWEKAPLLADTVKVSVAEMPPGPGGRKNDPNDDPATAWQVFTERRVSDGLNTLAAKIGGDFSSHAAVEVRPFQLPPGSSPLDGIDL